MIIDLHIHSTVSDGTDKPEEILKKVKEAGISLFSLTDHDAVKGSSALAGAMSEEDPRMISGAEFSCQDEKGKYHILGYRFDPEAEMLSAYATGLPYAAQTYAGVSSRKITTDFPLKMCFGL